MFENPEAAFGGASEILSLVELIYAAVEDASLWHQVMDRIAEAVHSECTVIFANYHRPGVHNIDANARIDPAALIPYAEYYGALNIGMARNDRVVPDGEIRYSHMRVPDSELEKTEYHAGFLRPNDLHYAMGIKIRLKDHAPALLSSLRPKRKGEFTRDEGVVFLTLLPHLQRALRLYFQFSTLRSNARGLEHALSAFDIAVFGINRSGKVVFANPNAEEIARTSDKMGITEGRLIATQCEQNAQLQHLISGSVANAASPGGALLLERGAGQSPLLVTVTPFTFASTRLHDQLVALVFVNDSSRKPSSRGELLRALYGLSPVECRLADLLAAGHEVPVVAEKLRLTIGTTRFHLKSIFRKTGTNRQVSLVRLILGVPGQLPSKNANGSIWTG